MSKKRIAILSGIATIVAAVITAHVCNKVNKRKSRVADHSYDSSNESLPPNEEDHYEYEDITMDELKNERGINQDREDQEQLGD